MNRNEALEEVRRRMQKKSGGGFTKDPMQFSPKQVKDGETAKYKFYVLPPLEQGDACATGKASKTMDLWYVTVGTHWINRRPYECPRHHDDANCPYCQLGFDLLKDCDDQDSKRNIISNYLAKSSHVVNIYFPPLESNPPELRGKVMWYSLPKAAFDAMEKAIMHDGSAEDSDDPVAYGLFYDPNDAYVFQLEVNHKGGFNEYSASKFLVKTKGPIARKQDGSADQVAIDKLLAVRHDIFTKYPARDANVLQAKVDEVLRGKNGDDQEPETRVAPKVEHKAQPTTQRAPAPATTKVVREEPLAEKITKELPKAGAKNDDPSDEELDKLLKELGNS